MTKFILGLVLGFVIAYFGLFTGIFGVHAQVEAISDPLIKPIEPIVVDPIEPIVVKETSERVLKARQLPVVSRFIDLDFHFKVTHSFGFEYITSYEFNKDSSGCVDVLPSGNLICGSFVILPI